MTSSEYPALFQNADTAAANRQRVYFRAILAQYALLLIAASVATLSSFLTPRSAALVYLICISLAGFLLLHNTMKKPEQDWYNARALAESVKTLSWRYMMGAEPFGLVQPTKIVRQEFASYIVELLTTHREAGDALVYGHAHGAQITDRMEAVRALSFSERKQFYFDERIDEQLQWYRQKATFNARRGRVLSYLCIAVYGFGIVAGAAQWQDPGALPNWISEPILVLAASLLGWIQARRYQELASSYNLTAHEISQARDALEALDEEDHFPSSVTQIEMAFSREHIQWVARQRSLF